MCILFWSIFRILNSSNTDNLSKTLQRADMSAAEGQEVICLTLATLKSLRNDSSFDLFLEANMCCCR